MASIESAPGTQIAHAAGTPARSARPSLVRIGAGVRLAAAAVAAACVWLLVMWATG